MIADLLTKKDLSADERDALSRWVADLAVLKETAEQNQSLLNGLFRGFGTVNQLAQITSDMGTVRAGDFISATAGLNPTDTDFIGSFVSAKGWTFGTTTAHVGGSNLGTLTWGGNSTNGDLIGGGGAVIINSNGLRINGDDTPGYENKLTFWNTNSSSSAAEIYIDQATMTPGRSNLMMDCDVAVFHDRVTSETLGVYHEIDADSLVVGRTYAYSSLAAGDVIFVGTASGIYHWDASGLSGTYQRASDDTLACSIRGVKSQGDMSAYTVIHSGDDILYIRALGYDGTQAVGSSRITFTTEGTIGTNRVPGVIEFYTQPDSATPGIVKRLSINSAGLFTFAGNLYIPALNIYTDTTTGMKICTATNQKLGFFNAAPVVQPTALTAAKSDITGGVYSEDLSIQSMTNTGPYGFVNANEGNTLVATVINLQTRLNELEGKLQALGLLA
jgi:hypothetical protein